MPWTVADVDRFKRGLDEEQKRRWVAIANGALAECMKQDSADELDCEVKAVRVANATVEGKEKAAALKMAVEPVVTSRSQTHTPDTRLHFLAADIDDVDGEPDGAFQLAFPVGLFKTGKYGELIITRTFVERMVDHWRAGANGNTGVFMDTNHDFGAANAWATDMRVTDRGLEVSWDFTERGRELVRDKQYRYYSAAIGWAVDTETGDELFPVLHAVSLTNSPVMNRMDEAHLSNTGTNRAHDAADNNTGGRNMTLKDVIELVNGLAATERADVTDEHRQIVADVFGMQLADPQTAERLTATEETITLLSQEKDEILAERDALKKEKQDAARDQAIEAALEAGKILPKNADAWREAYDRDPEGAAKLLATKGKEIDFEKSGTSRGADVALDDVDARVARDMGLSAEEYRELHGTVFGQGGK